MRVLVDGANGGTGRLIVARLAEAGHDAVAMVRDADQCDGLGSLGATHCVVADLEGDVVVEAVDAVMFAAGSGSSTGVDKTIRVDLMGAIRLIEASPNQTRFVMLSAMRTDDPDEGPERMRHYLAAKMEADRWLMASDLVWTIVRPGRLTDDAGAGRVRVARRLSEHGEIPRDDVAAVMVGCLDAASTHNKVFEVLSGPLEVAEALAIL